MTDEKLSKVPNANYEKFFVKLKEIDSLPVKDWNKNHVLGYFCKKYQEFYGTSYQFKFNTPAPSKCFEVWQISSLAGKLSSDPLILKTYIDWCFSAVAPKAKRKLTSVSFIVKDENCNYYKMNCMNDTIDTTAKLNRATQLPQEYREVFARNNSTIKTYGDLAFLYGMTDLPENIKTACNELEQLGFDKSILDKAV